MAAKAKKEHSNGVTADEARQAIALEKKQRAEACMQAIGEALKEFNCSLIPVVVIRNGQFNQTVEVLAND